MYGCESWTVKKAECWRINAFELCCWRRLLRVPWTARRSNQYILKVISAWCSFKDWCWNWKSNTFDSLEKTLMLGGIRGQEEKGTTEDEMAEWHHWLDGPEFGWTQGVGDGQGGLAFSDSWGCKEWDRTEPLKWTELNWILVKTRPTPIIYILR